MSTVMSRLGLCGCGCGLPTRIATRTDSRHGSIKGQPLRFINVGHAVRRDLATRFWEKVAKTTTPDGCWLWTSCRDYHGYGQIWCGRIGNDGRRVGPAHRKAHRVAWELANGPISAGLHVLHACDNPPCVRPSHLWLGTHADNAEDRKRKNRHIFGERTSNAKLDSTKVRAIRTLYQRGLGYKALARRFGVVPDTVRHVLKGNTWTHVRDEMVTPRHE